MNLISITNDLKGKTILPRKLISPKNALFRLFRQFLLFFLIFSINLFIIRKFEYCESLLMLIGQFKHLKKKKISQKKIFWPFFNFLIFFGHLIFFWPFNIFWPFFKINSN